MGLAPPAYGAQAIKCSHLAQSSTLAATIKPEPPLAPLGLSDGTLAHCRPPGGVWQSKLPGQFCVGFQASLRAAGAEPRLGGWGQERASLEKGNLVARVVAFRARQSVFSYPESKIRILQSNLRLTASPMAGK
jgi:hypothetical protein